MPRRPRIILPNVTIHIIQRGNNRQPCFFHVDDYRSYLDWLQEYSLEYECAIHAFVLMTNHVHLLMTPKTSSGPGKLMKRLGQRYVQYVNRTYGRSGTLWEGRYKSCLALEERYVLECYRYIELNPVRANLVGHPVEYRWSSYRVNGHGEKATLISPHHVYDSLAPEHKVRPVLYRELFRDHLEPGMIDEIRSATNGNKVFWEPVIPAQAWILCGGSVVRFPLARE